MASYQQNRYRNKQREYYNNPSNKSIRSNGVSGFNKWSSMRNKTRRGNKWSQHCHNDYAPSIPQPSAPRFRKENSRNYPHYSNSQGSKHFVTDSSAENTPEPNSNDNPKQSTKDTEHGNTKSYTQIVQQEIVNSGGPGSIGSAASTPEAVFVNSNNRKQIHYYQRKTMQTERGITLKAAARGTKRKRKEFEKEEDEHDTNQEDIDAQIAILEKATMGHISRRSSTAEEVEVESTPGTVGTRDIGNLTEESRDDGECQKAEHVESVEAQITKIELMDLSEKTNSVPDSVEEQETAPEIVVNPIDSVSPVMQTDMSPSLSAFAPEFSPDPHTEQQMFRHVTPSMTANHPEHSPSCPPPTHFQNGCGHQPSYHHGHNHNHQNHAIPPRQAPQDQRQSHGQYNNGTEHRQHMGHSNFYEQQQGAPNSMDVRFPNGFLPPLPPPQNQNVNRWEMLLNEQRQQMQQYQQQQQHGQHPQQHGPRPGQGPHGMFEMRDIPPRHQRPGQHPVHQNGNGNGMAPMAFTPPPQIQGQCSPTSNTSGLSQMSIPSPQEGTPGPIELGQNMNGEFFVSIDVECAATGHGHFDSAPCRIAMVDFFGSVLFDEVCNVPDLMDPLSEFTGLNAWQIQEAPPLNQVLHRFHAKLAELNNGYRFGVTIVGQSLIMDLIWTQLQYGVHYTRVIDIAQLFKTKSERWSKPTYYSLRQAAWGLMGCDMNGDFHDPTEDARVTMALYRECCLDGDILSQCKQRLKDLKWKKKFPNFKVHTKFYQCNGMYNPSRCRCGQKTAFGVDGVEDLETLRALYSEHRNNPVVEMKMY